MSTRPIELVLALLKGVRSSGDTGRQWTALCPAHDDKRSSFGVHVNGDGDVYLRCYANCTQAAVVAALGLEFKDLYANGKRKEEPKGCTISRLAFLKRLPIEWLKATCGLRDDGGSDNRKVEIPYRNEAGDEVSARIRSAIRAKDGSFWKRGTKPILYGLWLLDLFRERGGPILFVEGETDCWALWYHGFNALGVPGASAQRVLGDGEMLAGFDTAYVWREPDAAGAEFVTRMVAKLREVGYTGKILIVSAEGAKDPADVQTRHGDEFSTVFRGILEKAAPAEPATLAPVAALPQTVRRFDEQLRNFGTCEPGAFEFTDLGNAGRLEHLHGADLRWVDTWDQWHVWDGGRWAPDCTLEVNRRANLTVHSLALEATKYGGLSGLKDCMKWYDKSQSKRGLDAMIGLVKALGRIPVSHDQFDRQPWLLNCPNGTVDLRMGQVLMHRREDLLTTCSPTPFDVAATCPTWDQFLASVFPADPGNPSKGGNVNLISFVQKLLGYCLSGVVLSNLLPIFWGGGSNGKSTFLDVVQDVIGPAYAMQAPPGLLMTRQFEQHPTELADLFGKRFVVTTETQQNRQLDEAMVKQLTGGDKIRARRMREDFWEFAPTHKIVLCTNHRPAVRGNDHGIWRRLLLVPFQVRFWDPDRNETGPAHLRQDKDLKAKLKAESAGILAWLVRGCLAWQREGLEQPPDVRETTEEYRADQDVLGRFLGERYRGARPDADVLLKVFHQEFVRWAEENGEPTATTTRDVAADLRGRGFLVKPGTGNLTRIFGIARAGTTDGL